MNKYDEMDKRDREDAEAINLVYKKYLGNVKTLEGIPFYRFNKNGYIGSKPVFGKITGVEKPKVETKKVEQKPQHLQESKSKNNLPIHPKNLNIRANVLVKRLGMVLAPFAIAVAVLSGLTKRVNEKIEASNKEPTTITEVVEELDPDYLSKYFVIVNSTDPSTDALSDQITNDLAQMGVEVRGLHSDNELINTLINEESMCKFKNTAVLNLDKVGGTNKYEYIKIGVDEKSRNSDVFALHSRDAFQNAGFTVGVKIDNESSLTESEINRLNNLKIAHLEIRFSQELCNNYEKLSSLSNAFTNGFDNYARTPKKLQGKDCIHEVKGIGDVPIADLAKIYYGPSASDKVNSLYELNELKGDTIPAGATIITDKAPEPLAKTNTNNDNNNIGYY